MYWRYVIYCTIVIAQRDGFCQKKNLYWSDAVISRPMCHCLNDNEDFHYSWCATSMRLGDYCFRSEDCLRKTDIRHISVSKIQPQLWSILIHVLLEDVCKNLLWPTKGASSKDKTKKLTKLQRTSKSQFIVIAFWESMRFGLSHTKLWWRHQHSLVVIQCERLLVTELYIVEVGSR